jgi:hypothetical protein
MLGFESMPAHSEKLNKWLVKVALAFACIGYLVGYLTK